MRCSRTRSEGGFTLPEVLVVTIILAILATIAIATFFNQKEKADRSQAVSTLRNVQLHAETLRADSAGSVYVDDLSAYEAMGRYDFFDGSTSVDQPEHVSVSTASDGTWTVFASRGGRSCFYMRLDVGVESRIDHRVEGDGDCKAIDFESGPGDGW